MTLYAGENISFKLRGVDSYTKGIITDAVCTVNFYAPGKDPAGNLADRESPDYTTTAAYNSTDRYYEVTVPAATTNGWTPGIWTMQGVLSGGSNGYYNFGFESFTLGT